ncbi:non-ribosomal peptide synthetase [Streptomyces sp. TS71-3]|uniref:non-ribosomal peptide synthetase n=1 Tax=Streptomyces sp. TS71-3 TaxID=2733862 RepID=UPI001B2655B5|nr:non-ribosomal peptide synthetase [Streptomyces sp. TS71-3]GHJ41634.1 hypothetical protein Sm713_72430 [Streptomyces sp. TS71-3]
MDRWPLSYSQEALWFLCQLQPDSPFYNMSRGYRLRGPLDRGALEEALADVVGRHAALRTRVLDRGGRPEAVVDPPQSRMPLETADLSGLPAPEQDAELRRLGGELARRPFDLARAVPVRARLVALGAGEHVLHVVFHHIAIDRWSADRIFAPELAERYTARLAGGPPPGEPEEQFSDFARWQREHLTQERRRAQLAYWQEALTGAPAVLEVPGDRPRPPVPSHRGGSQAFGLPEDAAAGARELSRRARTTAFMTVLAAFAVATAQASGAEDLVVGVPVMSRGRFEHPDLIGMFVGTLPLRIDLRGAPTGLTALHRVRSAVLGGLTHGDVPFEDIVAALDIERDPSRNPLVQVLFQFEDRPPGGRFTAGDLSAEPAPLSGRSIRFDLELHLWTEPDGSIRGKASYAQDLYDPETVEGLVRRLGAALSGMAADPDAPLPGLGAPGTGVPGTGAPAVAARIRPAEEPRADRPAAPEPSALPRTPEERLVLDVWRDVLGAGGLTRDDNFFHVGGSSLRAARVAARLRQSLELDVPLRLLLEHRTAKDLAAALPGARKAAADGPDPAVRPERPPLSFGQERLWFLDQLVPGSTAYVLGTGLRLEGTLDPAVLRRALTELVRRHEALRTAFPADASGRPWQAVAPAGPVDLPVVEVPGVPDEDVGEASVRLARERITGGFPLATGPLLRTTLFRFGPALHTLVLHVHHSVCDAVSLGVMAREIALFYTAFAAGQVPEPDEPPLQYADYAVWQRRRAETGEAADDLAYWRGRLADPVPLDLPTDRPRPAVQSLRGGRYTFELPAGLTAAVLRPGEDGTGTPYTVLLAAYAALLGRYADQDDVCVATPVDDRSRADLERVVGFFADTTVMRIDLGGAPSFRDLLRRVGDTFLSAHEHRDVPFERLVAELAGEQDASRNPLAQAALVFHDAPVPAVRLGEVSARPFGLANPATRFDLELHVRVSGDRARCLFTYAADLFDEATVARLARHFVRLLGAALADPDPPLSRLDLLAPEERHQVLTAFNDTGADLGPPAALHELVEAQARRTPRAPAVVMGGSRLDYASLDTRADLLAARLAEAGAGPDRIVAVCLERSFELVVAVLAALKSGAAFLPLSPDDPPGRLAGLLADAEPCAVVTSAELRGRLPEDPACPVLDAARTGAVREPSGGASGVPPTAGCAPAPAEAGRVPDSPREGGRAEVTPTEAGRGGVVPAATGRAEVAPHHAAYVLYTSGSTGRPNGAVNTHEGIVNRLRWMQAEMPLGADDAVLHKTPVTFDVCVWELFWPLVAGARLVLAEPGAHRDPVRLAGVIREQRVTTVHFVPSLLRLFLAEPGAADACGSLRRVLCSGEALDPGLQERCRRALPGELYNLYGPAEAAIDVTFWRCPPGPRPAVVPIGRPIANTRLYVLDRHGRPVPPGVPGELHIGGAGVARGYLNRPELTEQRFVPDPFAPESGRLLFRTGDRVRQRPDGVLEFLGRRDDRVKVHGVRVELGEVEAALAAHPAVAAAAVAVREDSPGEHRLVGYAVPAPRVAGPGTADDAGGELASPEQFSRDLLCFLRGRLPLSMVPSALVLLDELPLSRNGKTDRRRLPAPHAAERVAVPPRDATEHALADLAGELLNTSAVGVTDDFFALGGNSILSARLMTRVERAFGRRPPLAAFLRQPTVEWLATAVRGRADPVPAGDGVVRLRAGTGGAPPLFLCAPLGGGVSCYRDLVLSLPDGPPVYGLRAPGLDEGSSPEPDLSRLLARHAAAVRAVQPAGPYRLAGWSFGGVVAFGVAGELARAGLPVAPVVLIDSYPETPHPTRERAAADFVTAFLREQGLMATRPAPPAGADGDPLAWILGRLRSAGLSPATVDDDAVARYWQVYATTAEAAAHYRPTRHSVPVLLLRPARPGRPDAPATHGWDALAEGPVDVRGIPGTHFTALTSEPARTIARSLTPWPHPPTP